MARQCIGCKRTKKRSPAIPSNNNRWAIIGKPLCLGRFFVIEYKEFLKFKKVFLGFILLRVEPPK